MDLAGWHCKHFLRILCVEPQRFVINIQCFSFDPFGTFGLIDLTNEETVQNYFSDNLRLWRVHAKEFYQDSVIINLSIAPVCDFNESMPVIYLSKTEKVYTRQIGRLSEDFFYLKNL